MPRAIGRFTRAFEARQARFYPTLYTDRHGNSTKENPWKQPPARDDPNTCPPLVGTNEPADFAFIYDPVNGSKIVRVDRKRPNAEQAA